ncbi:MAG: PrpF family protein, partial [Gammaproteobacteria bacterium]|nr:PrpF family protein [Gammaproteobacteria bacterium]
GGAGTGKLLPTGKVIDQLEVSGLGTVEVSMVDAANPLVFVEASSFGLTGTELPEDIDARTEVMQRLDSIRRHAAVVMGLARSPESASPAVPMIGLVAPAQDARTLAGEPNPAADGDLTARIVSSGNIHRALPLTGSICTTVAARIEGTLVHRNARPVEDPEADLRIQQPSGVLRVASKVLQRNGEWHAEFGATYRTQRRLFDGFVYVPAARVPGLLSLRSARSGGERAA